MLKRFKIIAVFVTVLVVPTLLVAADKVAPLQATLGADNTVTIPLEVVNQEGVMAIDMALGFSEGVTLKEVDFEGTRVSHFDLKIANIDNENNTVVIGLVSQMSPAAIRTLEAGRGSVANLVFEVDNESVGEINLEAIVTENPSHSMTFVYDRRVEGEVGHVRTSPDFGSVSVSLSGVSGAGNLPTEFGLDQNYPNPFNPSTNMAFSLPEPSRVNLSVFNVLGQHVRTVVDEDMPAGYHTVVWDGANESGSTVASGLYFYRLEAGSFVETKKAMVLK